MPRMTKKRLSDALKQMLAKMDLEKITIGDLADLCGINRKTFYYHFKDIYELMEWTVETDFEDAINGHDTYDTWQEGFLSVLSFAKNDRAFILSAYPYLNREQVGQCLERLMHKLLMAVLEDKACEVDIEDGRMDDIATFYQHALVGVMEGWLRNGMKEEPEELMRRFGAIAQQGMTEALTMYAKAPLQKPTAKKRGKTSR